MTCLKCRRELTAAEQAACEQPATSDHSRSGVPHCDQCWRWVCESLCGPPGVEGPHGLDRSDLLILKLIGNGSLSTSGISCAISPTGVGTTDDGILQQLGRLEAAGLLRRQGTGRDCDWYRT